MRAFGEVSSFPRFKLAFVRNRFEEVIVNGWGCNRQILAESAFCLRKRKSQEKMECTFSAEANSLFSEGDCLFLSPIMAFRKFLKHDL